MFRHLLAVGTMLSTGTFAPTAFAQMDPTIDDEIVVTATYLSIDKLNSVKTPTPIIDVPQSVSVIDNIQIRKQGFTSIADITRYAPGLNNSQGEGHRDAIIIRGNQTTSDFFQDGVRDDVQYFRPLYNLEQVEILRGANALLFGRGGVGGIINRVTKKADSNDSFKGLVGSVDTFGAYQAAVDINRPLGDTAAFRVNGFFESLNNQRGFYDGERFGINPTVRLDVSPQTTVDLSYEYLDDDRVVDRGVPSQNVANGPDIPLEGFDNTFFGSADQNFTTLQAHILRGRVDHSFSDTLRGNLTAQFANYDKLYQNLYASEEVNVTNGVFPEVELDGYRDTTDRENVFLQGNLVGEFETGRFGHTILIGAEYGTQDTSNVRFDNVFDNNGDGLLQPGIDPDGAGPLQADDDQFFIPFTDPLNIPLFGYIDPARNRASNVTIFSAYIQDQIDLTEHLKIVVGARFDSFDIDVNDIGNAAQFSRKDEEITPRFGVIYKPAENMSFYGSFSQTFVPRSGDQFLTLNLDAANTRPQFTENLEAGAKWNIRPDLSFTAAVFNLDRESYTSVDPNNPARLITIDGSKTTGFELALEGNLTDRWEINTGYTYMDGRVEDLNIGGLDGNEPRQLPEHMFSIWNNYQLNDQLGFGLGATYQDSYFVREDNSVEVPSYIRFDAAAYYDVSEDLRLQLNLENLLDESYNPDAHSNDNISTGKPLNARFTVSTKF